MGNFLFFSAGIIQYFKESNAAGQIIVVLLCVFSLIAWTVMLGKWSDLKELSRLNKIAEHKIAKSFDIVEFADGNRSLAGPYGKVLKEAAAHRANDKSRAAVIAEAEHPLGFFFAKRSAARHFRGDGCAQRITSAKAENEGANASAADAE